MKKFQLPKEFGIKWLEALRSGKYKQGKRRLFNINNDSYCCLGVAGSICEIANEFITGKPTTFDNDIFPIEILHKIPQEIRGNCLRNHLVYNLVKLNDNGKTFIEIADWIEQNCDFY